MAYSVEIGYQVLGIAHGSTNTREEPTKTREQPTKRATARALLGAPRPAAA